MTRTPRALRRARACTGRCMDLAGLPARVARAEPALRLALLGAP
eukprot:CAMPEP_0204220438 /NCGR_PEP_ID=MMETSP0361-20130328/80944_1 /ASSEMBLY_ACC=CAM_ASM_000343 /TAXON_ID=268821 /ORGANISM="Scrippsiella Hangoei, Strain SHTV-5" /LENGTH=43 /DNA_ID= /DNA_START= /DNA_END= /DNA_ORIENTATION=